MFNLMQQFGGLPQGPPEPIVRMKAGKMECAPMPDKPGSFMISAIRGRGELQLVKDPVDQILRCQWKSRVSNTVDQDMNQMLFSGDAELVKVDTKREGDRVVLLRFAFNPARRFFFWLQDKDDAQDEELLKKFNDTMNSGGEAAPAETPAATPGGALPSGLSGSPDRQAVQMEALQNVLSNMGLPPALTTTSAANPSSGTMSASQSGSQASATLPATGGATTSAATAATSPASPGITAEALQAAMMSVASAANRARPTPLQDIVTAEEVERTGILANPEVAERLLSALPEGRQTPEELRATIRSPQFQQTLTSLSAALQTENYNSIFANFGLDASAGAAALAQGNGIQAFLDALNAQAEAEQSGSGGDGDASAPGEGNSEEPGERSA
mmetsp:Transcript_3941/g.11555  ORF Transcript_3941/g.11555 Transcript_3941/m.11555 type:complete len:387 (-) Transcript_3941:413-1573(-)